MNIEQNAVGSNTLSTMNNQELGNLIIKGQPGSQRSEDAILELVRRRHALKNELIHVWGIESQPIARNAGVEFTDFSKDSSGLVVSNNSITLNAIIAVCTITVIGVLSIYGINGIFSGVVIAAGDNAIRGLITIFSAVIGLGTVIGIVVIAVFILALIINAINFRDPNSRTGINV